MALKDYAIEKGGVLGAGWERFSAGFYACRGEPGSVSGGPACARDERGGHQDGSDAVV